MGNACHVPSGGLSNIYFSGLNLMSPGMASKDGIDPVHPNVARQKQYQVRKLMKKSNEMLLMIILLHRMLHSNLLT